MTSNQTRSSASLGLVEYLSSEYEAAKGVLFADLDL